MSQTSIESYFNSRKRRATGLLNPVKAKLIALEGTFHLPCKELTLPDVIEPSKIVETPDNGMRQYSDHRATSASDKVAPNLASPAKVASVEMTLAEPQGKSAATAAESKPVETPRTPSKSTAASLSLADIKEKLKKRSDTTNLRSILQKIQHLDGQRQSVATKLEEKQNPNLAKFKTIEMDILTSPKKKTPTKHQQEVNVDSCFTNSSAFTNKHRDQIEPAYRKYQHLADPDKSQLPLPFKYRSLLEVFKSVDSICALFFNRNEVITFNKLKPAVQRNLRKNFTEKHLSQIQRIHPLAYEFYQMKMRNFGSTSKADYYQLVIKPKVDDFKSRTSQIIEEKDFKQIMETTSQLSTANLIERQKHFATLLLDKALEQHELFLHSLEPPIEVARSEIRRWHPEFELEKCAEVEAGSLPQPPNYERMSSARDILNTARNLFKDDHLNVNGLPKEIEKGGNIAGDSCPAISQVLKDVPKSLLEKIRARQAAKALETMTRNASTNEDGVIYSRLPEIARHVRNVFVTEKKSSLPLSCILIKLENSFRSVVTPEKMQMHVQLIAKELPQWLSFHVIRNTTYVRIAKDVELTKVIEQLDLIFKSKGL